MRGQAREKLWRHLHRRGVCTIREAADECGIPFKTAYHYFRQWEQSGSVCADADKRYRIAEHRAEAPRLRQDGSEIGESTAAVLWRTMKILHTFTRDELHAHVLLTHRIGRAATLRYTHALIKAGYLRSAGKGRLTLTANTGPLPPQVGTDGSVADPNTGKTVPGGQAA